MNIHALFDKRLNEAQVSFEAARKTERYYIRQIRKIAAQVSNFVNNMWKYELGGVVELAALLTQYSHVIDGWSRAVTERMHLEVSARNKIQWNQYMAQLGAELERDIRTAPVGEELRELLNSQVHLIKSIPRKEAQRVHELTIKGLTTGERYETIRDKILETNHITKARADLIAITEVARTASVLTQVRAMHVGSEFYIWRTARDPIVRPTHRALEGTVHKWSEPPLCDLPDYHAHPGQIFRCRCHASPIIPLGPER